MPLFGEMIRRCNKSSLWTFVFSFTNQRTCLADTTYSSNKAISGNLDNFMSVSSLSNQVTQCSKFIVVCLLKARILKSTETAVARERLCKHACCKAMAQ
jgi:hypothetical protein